MEITGSGLTWIAPINEGSCVYAAVTVGVAAVQLKVGADNLAGRKGIFIKNSSDAVIYVGFNNSVSTASGVPLSAETSAAAGDGGEIWIDVGSEQDVFAICGAAGKEVRIMELK